jgi:hypothetical protein
MVAWIWHPGGMGVVATLAEVASTFVLLLYVWVWIWFFWGFWGRGQEIP